MVVGASCMAMSDKESLWRSRIAAWRASGKTAAAFSDEHGYAAGTLLWWSSRLRRKPTESSAPLVRLARVVCVHRDEQHGPAPATPGLIVELLDASARITITGSTDIAVLTAVIGALREARR
jgi:hypothetical protein